MHEKPTVNKLSNLAQSQNSDRKVNTHFLFKILAAKQFNGVQIHIKKLFKYMLSR